MMDIWLYSDPHFGHANILNFTNDKGEKIRPCFDSVEDMDEQLISKFNARVGIHDKVYFLGDIAFKQDAFDRVMPRLNGSKRLILGNHDKLPMISYIKYFKKIYESWQPVRNTLFTHRPIHLGDHHEKIAINVHGHLHQNVINDNRYLNVCVEQTDYYPIHFDQVKEIALARGIKIE